MDAQKSSQVIGAPGIESGRILIAIFRFPNHTRMDDVLEIPSADVSNSQEREQGEEPDDGNSSADEEEGGLDWSKLPCVFR
jgi:hypothetical protein